MQNFVNIEFLRRRFEKINSFYGAQGLTPQLSMIRIEEDLINGQGSYAFDLKKENLSPVEKNLKRNDLFVVCSMAVATRLEIDKPNDDNTLKARPNTTLPSFNLYDVMGSANRSHFDPYFKTDDIKALYNGSLYISSGTTVNFQDIPLSLFKNNEDSYTDLYSTGNIEDKMRVMAEEIIFSGTQDHTIKINFPTFAQSDYSSQIAAGGDMPVQPTTSKVVFMALGFRVIGGTQNIYKVAGNPYSDCI